MKRAVLLFNLGGPDKLDSVQPFLFNLFNDPSIISIPSLFRYPLAKLISFKRAPTAKKIYMELGGGSPILKLTEEQAANVREIRSSYDKATKLPEELVEEKGITVILVTHEAHIAEFASRVITLKDGLIISDKKV